MLVPRSESAPETKFGSLPELVPVSESGTPPVLELVPELVPPSGSLPVLVPPSGSLPVLVPVSESGFLLVLEPGFLPVPLVLAPVPALHRPASH